MGSIRRPPEVQAKAQAMFAAGLTMSTIAKQLDLPLETVKTWSKRFKWGSTRALVREPATKAVVQIVQDHAEQLKESLSGTLAQAVRVAAEHPVTYAELANESQGHAGMVKTLAETYRALHGSAESQVIVFGVGKLREPAIEIETTPQAVVSGPESGNDNSANEAQ